MATFTVSERSTLWLRAISIRTSGMIPMSCKMNTTNGRPGSLGGRIAISKPSSGSFIRLGFGRLHDALGNHRNTAIIPVSSGLWARPQLASLVGGAATDGSAGAPGPGETAGRTSSFPERGPVGPRAAGWIAGPSPSKRHLPITPPNVQLATSTYLSVVPAFPRAQPAPLRRPRSRLAEKKQPGLLRPDETPEILRGQTFQRSEARRGKFQGWMKGILGNRTGDGEGSKKAARTRRVRRSPEHRRLADVFGVRHKEEQALRGWMDPIPVRDGGPSGQRPPLRLSISRNPQLRQNGQHRNQRRSHGLPPLLHQAYSFQHSAEGDPICPRAILTLG